MGWKREFDSELLNNIKNKLRSGFDGESVWIYCKKCNNIIARKFYYEDRGNIEEWYPNHDFFSRTVCSCNECEFLDLEDPPLSIYDIFQIINKINRNFGTKKLFKIYEEKQPKKPKEEKADIELMAFEIMADNIFLTTKDNEDIYYYNDGIYHNGGEIKIKEEADKRYPNISSHSTKEIIFHIKAKTYIERSILDSNPNLIFLKNGVFDLENMKLKDFSPDLISIVQLPMEYNSESDCILFKRFLSEIVNEEDISAVQELFGYCLYRDYHIQKAFMLIGEGANGKSTLLGVLREFLGGSENVSSVPLQDFDNNNFASSMLVGKLANIYADLTDQSLYTTGRFKLLTGGDQISAERKFKNPFTFINYAKLIFSANKAPKVYDDTNAFFRRWIFLRFPNSFEGKDADKRLLSKLTTSEELSGIFNWAIVGLKRLLEEEDFTYNPSTEETKDEYIRMSDPMRSFINEHIMIDPQAYIIKQDIYSYYSEYCNKNKLPAIPSNIFHKDLPRHISVAKRGRTKIAGKQEPCWFGIKYVEIKEEKEWDEGSNEEKTVVYGRNQTMVQNIEDYEE